MSRLGHPYGDCNNLDTLKKDAQPFFFNGSYSVEGCYRSCFQDQLSQACGCADPRFPLPTDGSTSNFCVAKNADDCEFIALFCFKSIMIIFR